MIGSRLGAKLIILTGKQPDDGDSLEEVRKETREILSKAREIWGTAKTSLPQMSTLLGVVHGDLCRQARTELEGQLANKEEVAKELGNLIASAIRWCDDLGLDPDLCVDKALKAQARYSKKVRAA